MNTDPEAALKPCPFCGALPNHSIGPHLSYSPQMGYWHTICGGCNTWVGSYKTDGQAALAWNTRTPQADEKLCAQESAPPKPEVLEALKKIKELEEKLLVKEEGSLKQEELIRRIDELERTQQNFKYLTSELNIAGFQNDQRVVEIVLGMVSDLRLRRDQLEMTLKEARDSLVWASWLQSVSDKAKGEIREVVNGIDAALSSNGNELSVRVEAMEAVVEAAIIWRKDCRSSGTRDGLRNALDDYHSIANKNPAPVFGITTPPSSPLPVAHEKVDEAQDIGAD